jgi:hypothetical protein
MGLVFGESWLDSRRIEFGGVGGFLRSKFYSGCCAPGGRIVICPETTRQPCGVLM